jgi:hypothetical protein
VFRVKASYLGRRLTGIMHLVTLSLLYLGDGGVGGIAQSKSSLKEERRQQGNKPKPPRKSRMCKFASPISAMPVSSYPVPGSPAVNYLQMRMKRMVCFRSWRVLVVGPDGRVTRAWEVLVLVPDQENYVFGCMQGR